MKCKHIMRLAIAGALAAGALAGCAAQPGENAEGSSENPVSTITSIIESEDAESSPFDQTGALFELTLEHRGNPKTPAILRMTEQMSGHYETRCYILDPNGTTSIEVGPGRYTYVIADPFTEEGYQWSCSAGGQGYDFLPGVDSLEEGETKAYNLIFSRSDSLMTSAEINSHVSSYINAVNAMEMTDSQRADMIEQYAQAALAMPNATPGTIEKIPDVIGDSIVYEPRSW